MKTNVVMKIACENCKVQHDITNENIDDFNIYYIMGGGNNPFKPHLLCPVCTIENRKEM